MQVAKQPIMEQILLVLLRIRFHQRNQFEGPNMILVVVLGNLFLLYILLKFDDHMINYIVGLALVLNNSNIHFYLIHSTHSRHRWSLIHLHQHLVLDFDFPTRETNSLKGIRHQHFQEFLPFVLLLYSTCLYPLLLFNILLEPSLPCLQNLIHSCLGLTRVVQSYKILLHLPYQDLLFQVGQK